MSVNQPCNILTSRLPTSGRSAQVASWLSFGNGEVEVVSCTQWIKDTCHELVLGCLDSTAIFGFEIAWFKKGLNRFGGLLVMLWLETFNGNLRHLMRQRLKNGWTSQQDAAFKIVVSFAHHRHDRGSAWLKVRPFSCFGFILLRKRRAFVLTWGAFCILQPARFWMVFVRFCWI